MAIKCACVSANIPASPSIMPIRHMAELMGFLFVIMLLNLKEDAGHWMARDKNKLLTGLTAVLLVGGLYKIIDVIMQTDFKAAPAVQDSFGTVARIGESLFTDFVLPFEMASVLLLVAMVGAVVLAKSKLD